jgi:hypothetical protein
MKAISLCILTLLFLSGCTNKSGQESIVTDRIQYDVTIKNKEADADWWVQNIEGRKRESLLTDIFEGVQGGKIKIYDYFSDKELSKAEIAAIFRKTDTISVESPNPPYQLVDTVMVHELKSADITRLRFLEEWSMDKKTLQIKKKVKGICPLLENYSETGELRGYQPLFWVFFDDAYPAELKGK